MSEEAPPWEWPVSEWSRLPVGPMKEVETFNPKTGMKEIRPELPPIKVRHFGADEPIASVDGAGRLWRFGQWPDGSWYKEPVYGF